MANSRIGDDLHVAGRLSCTTFVPPTGSITDAAIAEGAGIDADKCQQQYVLRYCQAAGSAVVANTGEFLHCCRGATGEVVQIDAVIFGTIATGADRTVTIDLKKSTAGGAYATILSAPIVLDNTNVIRVLESGTLTGATLVEDDTLQLTVAVAGAAGNQAIGLGVSVYVREDPDEA